MKKIALIIGLIFIALVAFIVIQMRNSPHEKTPQSMNAQTAQDKSSGSQVALANPASTHCEENMGTLEIVTNNDGSQFGMCHFDDYSCEEWAYFNGECTPEEDSEKIKNVLIEKGLDLSNMKVVVNKHLGKYIAGGVVPVSAPGGGGYVFAVKEGEEIKVLADGNGAIMCSAFSDYPDFPTYLVSVCIDDTGNPLTR